MDISKKKHLHVYLAETSSCAVNERHRVIIATHKHFYNDLKGLTSILFQQDWSERQAMTWKSKNVTSSMQIISGIRNSLSVIKSQKQAAASCNFLGIIWRSGYFVFFSF